MNALQFEHKPDGRKGSSQGSRSSVGHYERNRSLKRRAITPGPLHNQYEWFEPVIPADIASRVIRKKMDETEMKKYIANRSVTPLSSRRPASQASYFQNCNDKDGPMPVENDHTPFLHSREVNTQRDNDIEEHLARMRSRMDASKKLQSIHTQMFNIVKQLECDGNEDVLAMAEKIGFPVMDLIGGGGDPSLYTQNMQLLVDSNREKVKEILRQHDNVTHSRNMILGDLSQWLDMTYERDERDLAAELALEQSTKKLISESEKSVNVLIENMRGNGDKLLSLKSSLSALIKSLDLQMIQEDGMSNEVRKRMSDLLSQLNSLDRENREMEQKLDDARTRARILDTLLTREAKEKDIYKLKNEKETDSSKKQLELLREQWKLTEMEYQKKIKYLRKEFESQSRRMRNSSLLGNLSERSERYTQDFPDFVDFDSSQAEIDRLKKENEDMMKMQEKLRTSVQEKDREIKQLKQRLKDMRIQEVLQEQPIDSVEHHTEDTAVKEYVQNQDIVETSKDVNEKMRPRNLEFDLTSARNSMGEQARERLDYTQRVRELLGDDLMHNLQQSVFEHFMKWDERYSSKGNSVSRDSEERAELLDVLLDMVMNFRSELDTLSNQHIETLLRLSEEGEAVYRIPSLNQIETKSEDVELQQSERKEDIVHDKNLEIIHKTPPHEIVPANSAQEIEQSSEPVANDQNQHLKIRALEREVELLRQSESHARKELRNVKMKLEAMQIREEDDPNELDFVDPEIDGDTISKWSTSTIAYETPRDNDDHVEKELGNIEPARDANGEKELEQRTQSPQQQIDTRRTKKPSSKSTVRRNLSPRQKIRHSEETRKQRFERLFQDSNRKVRNAATIQHSSFQLDILRLLRRISEDDSDTIMTKVDDLLHQYQQKIAQLEEQKQQRNYYYYITDNKDEKITRVPRSSPTHPNHLESLIRTSPLMGWKSVSTQTYTDSDQSNVVHGEHTLTKASMVNYERQIEHFVQVIGSVEDKLDVLFEEYHSLRSSERQIATNKNEQQTMEGIVVKQHDQSNSIGFEEKLQDIKIHIRELRQNFKEHSNTGNPSYHRLNMFPLSDDTDMEEPIPIHSGGVSGSWSFMRGEWNPVGSSLVLEGKAVSSRASTPLSRLSSSRRPGDDMDRYVKPMEHGKQEAREGFADQQQNIESAHHKPIIVNQRLLDNLERIVQSHKPDTDTRQGWDSKLIQENRKNQFSIGDSISGRQSPSKKLDGNNVFVLHRSHHNHLPANDVNSNKSKQQRYHTDDELLYPASYASKVEQREDGPGNDAGGFTIKLVSYASIPSRNEGLSGNNKSVPHADMTKKGEELFESGLPQEVEDNMYRPRSVASIPSKFQSKQIHSSPKPSPVSMKARYQKQLAMFNEKQVSHRNRPPKSIRFPSLSHDGHSKLAASSFSKSHTKRHSLTSLDHLPSSAPSPSDFQ